jgi:hypothetical protein
MRSKNNPLLFVTDVLGATPEPWQAIALEAVGRHDRVSIRSGHGVGKTTLEAWLILWFLLTHQNCKVPVAANSQDQLRDTIWPEIAKWHRQLPEELKANIDVQAERIVVVHDPEGAFAVRRTASKDNPEALQGFHADCWEDQGRVRCDALRCQAKRNFGRHHWPGRWGLRPLQRAWSAGARGQCRRGGGFGARPVRKSIIVFCSAPDWKSRNWRNM